MVSISKSFWTFCEEMQRNEGVVGEGCRIKTGNFACLEFALFCFVFFYSKTDNTISVFGGL